MPDEDIQPVETPDTGASDAGSSEQGQGAPATHYKTLEDADSAARRFQGERDRLQSDIDRLTTLTNASGQTEKVSVNDVVRFRDQMLPIAERADFPDYLRGSLGAKPEAQPSVAEEEYLTDAEKEARSERQHLRDEVRKTSASLAKMNFSQYVQQVQDGWGGLLNGYKAKAETAFDNIVQLGGITDPSKLNREFVENLYLQQVPLEERPALFEQFGKQQAERKLSHQQSKGTTVPSPERPSEETAAPKSLKEAMKLGFEHAERERIRAGG